MIGLYLGIERIFSSSQNAAGGYVYEMFQSRDRENFQFKTRLLRECRDLLKKCFHLGIERIFSSSKSEEPDFAYIDDFMFPSRNRENFQFKSVYRRYN